MNFTDDEPEDDSIDPDDQRDYVLRTVEERGIRFIQLWFTDVLGTAKMLTITPAELESALEEGMTFDGSSIDGFSRVSESDVLACPDPQTFQLLPWRSGDAPTARVVCDIFNIDGTPFEGCPRHVLRRVLEQAKQRGFTFYVAPEIEYFYFADKDPSSSPKLLDSGSYFELTTNDIASELRKQTVLTLEEMGIPVEHAQHEDAPSQHEIDLRYTDALTMADTIMTTRLLVKEIAHEHGIHASFMPKPLAGIQGSGMHTHLSLFKGPINAFADQSGPYGLSATAQQFTAGLLYHAPEITAITNQWVNSYKRLVSGYEAPTSVSWARHNRSALIRVPFVKKGKIESTRIEFRSPDSACNPYLTFAVILAAGLKGIDLLYELPPEATTVVNSYHTKLADPNQITEEEITFLPGSLSEAIEQMAKSKLVAETLGSHVFEWFIRNKSQEWEAYRTHVSQFEIDRYFPLL